MLLLAGGRWVVVEGRVAASAVVEDLDEVEDRRRPQVRSSRPWIAVEQLALQGGEEALGDRVIECIPTVPIEATRSEAARRRPKANEVY